jgi:hypothetical protein
LVPEIAGVVAGLPRVEDVTVLDPGRAGYAWELREASIDEVMLLGPADGPAACMPVAQTDAIAALVPEVFPLLETKTALLREVAAAVTPARCHRLVVAEPASMRAAVLDSFGGVG